MNTTNTRVVITGMGPLASTGIGKSAFWNGLIKNKINKNIVKDNDSLSKHFLYSVKGFNIRDFNIPYEKIEEIKLWKEGEEIFDLNLLIASVKLALEDSKLRFTAKNNIGLIVTHENPGLEQYFTKIIDVVSKALKKNIKLKSRRQVFNLLVNKLMKSSYELQTFMLLYHIGKVFDIHGYSLFLNNACASGLYALETATQIIRSGKCPIVIVSTADAPGIYKYLWFKELGLTAEDGIIMPFDKNAHGFVLGDGSVSIVLESLKHAEKRNAHIYAEYVGGNFMLESWKITLPAVGMGMYTKVINGVLETCKIKKEDINVACLHGVSVPVIDKYEALAMKEVFGVSKESPLVTTFKPYIGHTLGASSLLETAILVLCMENEMLLPILNLRNIDETLKLNFVQKYRKIKIDLALKTCCAFAGYDAAVILRKV